MNYIFFFLKIIEKKLKNIIKYEQKKVIKLIKAIRNYFSYLIIFNFVLFHLM